MSALQQAEQIQPDHNDRPSDPASDPEEISVLLGSLPLNAQRVLEIGCGSGALARAWRRRHPTVHYTGIETDTTAANSAREHCDEVLNATLESTETSVFLKSISRNTPFDLLILGDGFSATRDPSKMLSVLRKQMVPGGVCVAILSNFSHWSNIGPLLRGRWTHSDSGSTGAGPLRFFTLQSANDLLTGAGWQLLGAKPAARSVAQAYPELAPLLACADSLGTTRAELEKNLLVKKWVIRAANPPVMQSQRLTVLGIGLKKIAGVTEARVDFPLASLATLPRTRIRWGSGAVKIPENLAPGVLVLHRKLLIPTPKTMDFIETHSAAGWVIVLDFDDDPHFWKEVVRAKFRGFSAIHAVSVSTERLATMFRQWNPNVKVLPNAIYELPEVSDRTPKSGRMKIFFGALNRGGDWAAIREGLLEAVKQSANHAEYVVVHDKAFFDELPGGVSKIFHPTLPIHDYLRELGQCDIALLPLAETSFNQYKSDIKFIECCAAGVVPICSPTIYEERPEHREIGLFAKTANDWRDALLYLIANPDNVASRRLQGLDYVSKSRMHAHQVATRETWYRWLLANRVNLEAQRRHRVATFNQS